MNYVKQFLNRDDYFFCPLSIEVVMAMCSEGAKGKTKEEINQAFNFPQEIDHKKIESTLKELIGSGTFTIGTIMWMQQNYPFLKSFIDKVSGYSQAESVNFASEGIVNAINYWCELNTNGKIKQLVSEGLVNEDTRLVIANALYFKAKWDKIFIETTKEDFITFSGKKKCDMMHLEADFLYYEDEKMQMLRLPYKEDNLSMIVVLPKGDFVKFQKEWEDDYLKDSFKDTEIEKVIVQFPKFKLESNFLLSEELKKVGITEAFSNDANFAGMTTSKDIRLSEVIHKACVDVTEEGTEAAAATAAVFLKCVSMVDVNPPKQFIANHPFLFFIMNGQSVVFMGKFNG